MIKPFLKGKAFLEDIQNALKQIEKLHVWWLGQSGFLIQWNGEHLLFDPYLSDSLTRKYAETDKPHTRMTEQVVDPLKLNFIDVTTSSHNHTDHLDHETLIPLMKVNPEMELVVPSANQKFAADRLKVAQNKLRSINTDKSLKLGKFEIHAIPAAHEELSTDIQGRHHFLGYIAKIGPWVIYHSGDTIPYEGMEELLSQWNINVALLPINGRRPERRVAGNLWGTEAAHLAKSIGAEIVIPCHYEMFEFNTETPKQFESECIKIKQDYKTLRAGQRWSGSPNS